METQIQVTCEYCKTPFQKNLRRVNASLKKGWKHCCSASCRSQLANQANKGRNIAHLNPYNRVDDLTPFRYFVNNMRASGSKKRKPISLTANDLKEIWEKQKGICPFTGWELKLPPRAHGWNKAEILRDRASVDRIDNTKGYCKENVRFVALIANLARNQFSDTDVTEFCKAVVKEEDARSGI